MMENGIKYGKNLPVDGFSKSPRPSQCLDGAKTLYKTNPWIQEMSHPTVGWKFSRPTWKNIRASKEFPKISTTIKTTGVNITTIAEP